MVWTPDSRPCEQKWFETGLYFKHPPPPPYMSCVPATYYILQTTHYGLQTTKYIPQTTDYRRLQSIEKRPQTKEYRLQTTEYGIQATDYRLQIADYRLQSPDYRLPTTDYRIVGVQNKTGANCLLSPSTLHPVNRSGLKLVCILNTPPPHVMCTCYRLHTTDHRPKTSH